MSEQKFDTIEETFDKMSKKDVKEEFKQKEIKQWKKF
jgi:hypothetical protein